MPYEVQTPLYQGPFDLLLRLILRDEIDLYQLSLHEIVDSYVAEVAAMGSVDLELATEFLVIAATLVELKTRRLLPSPGPMETDEELAAFEERDLLLARLLEAKTFKDAAAALSRLTEAAGRSRPRRAGPEEHFLALAPDLLAGVTPSNLHEAYLRAVGPRPQPRVDLDHVAPVRVSVAEAVDELAARLPGMGTVGFRRLTAGLPDRLHVVVHFLALLELYKQGEVELEQWSNFGELHVRWTGVDRRGGGGDGRGDGDDDRAGDPAVAGDEAEMATARRP